MSKAKSVAISVILAIAVAVAAFFAVVSFPLQNNVKRFNSLLSQITLSSDYTGYAYATIYPEGVISAEEYGWLSEEEKAGYVAEGGLYVDTGKTGDVAALKAQVKKDAESLNARFGQKGYSSYTVATEDGVSIRISVPTNMSYAAYKGYDETAAAIARSYAGAALNYLTAYGELTLRTTDESISLTDANGNSITYDCTKNGKDKWVDTAIVESDSGESQKTYSLANGDDAAEYFKSITCRSVGANAVITFKFTSEGAEKFNELTTRASSSSSQTIHFFVGDRQLVDFKCEQAVTGKSLTLQANNYSAAENMAIPMNSAVNGGALGLNYGAINTSTDVKIATAAGGGLTAILTFVACVIILAAACVLLVLKYKKLGAVLSFMSVIFALVELYALVILNIMVTFAVVFVCVILLALFISCNAILFNEVKRLTLTGRTIQASVKEAYKNLLTAVIDTHVVLVVAALFLATVGVGEVAACGLISLIGVVASFVLYWFTRFMWFVISSPVKDKFAFAGLKRVVYEDD